MQEFALCFLLRDPVPDTQCFELLPLRDIRHVVEQIVVEVVGPQPSEFFVEILV